MKGKHVILFLLDKAMLGKHKQRYIGSTDHFVNPPDAHVDAYAARLRKSRFTFTFMLVLNNTEQYK